MVSRFTPMDFTKEPHVRIYTTVSPTARLWGFFGRALMDQLVKAADRAGVIELPEELKGDLPAAVASAIHCPNTTWMREWLPKIMEHGAARHVVIENDDEDGPEEAHYLVLTRYHEAQYATISKTLSNTMSERKRKDTERAIELGIIEPPFWWTDREEEGAA